MCVLRGQCVDLVLSEDCVAVYQALNICFQDIIRELNMDVENFSKMGGGIELYHHG